MNKQKLFIFFVLILMIYTGSCKIQGSFAGITSQFHKCYKKDSALYEFVKTSDTQRNLQPDKKVYIITDKYVQNILDHHPKVILYDWSPLCQSPICYPLTLIYKKCVRHHITFIPVSECFDNTLMKANLNNRFCIYAPDIKYYRTNFTAWYLKKFYRALGVEDYAQGKGRFTYFENGKLKKQFMDVNEIDRL